MGYPIPLYRTGSALYDGSHQRKGLGSVVFAALLRSILQKSSSTPFVRVFKVGYGRVIAEKLGFVSDDVEVCCIKTGSSNC